VTEPSDSGLTPKIEINVTGRSGKVCSCWQGYGGQVQFIVCLSYSLLQGAILQVLLLSYLQFSQLLIRIVHFLLIIIALLPLIPGLNHFMPEVDPAAEVFLRNLIHTSDIRVRGRYQAPANLGTEAEKVVAAVGIARYVWTLADHEPNINLVGVVRIYRYIQNFTIGHSSFLVVDVLICAYDFVQKSTVDLLIRGSCFKPWVNIETAVEAHRDLMELFEFSVFSAHEPRNGTLCKQAKKEM
jgi:hypothetical protein